MEDYATRSDISASIDLVMKFQQGTRDMLMHTMDLHHRATQESFRGVFARQDATNGRVLEMERQLGQHDGVINGIEHDITLHATRLTAVEDVKGINGHRSAVTLSKRASLKERITMRDVKMVGYGGGGIIALAKLVEYLIAVLKHP